MPSSHDHHTNLEPLREGLRRAGAVAGFAARMARDGVEIPPGLIADFNEARAVVEREYVRVHENLTAELQRRLKELLLKTRNLTPEVMGKGAEKLNDRLRHVLNHLMIDGGMHLSLTEEIFDKAESESTQHIREGVAPALAPPPPAKPARPASGRLPLLTGALLALVIVAAAAGAWGLGLFDGQPAANNSRAAANTDQRANTNRPPSNTPAESGEGTFDRVAAGYTRPLRAQPLHPAIDPLNAEVDLRKVLHSEWPLLELGLEELVETLEPARLKLKPHETRRRLEAFAAGAEKSEPGWIDARTKFLDAFVGHVRSQLQLAAFSDGPQVLLSDVFNAKGGPRLPLLLAYFTLARASNAELALIAPMGADFPLLSQRVKSGTATFDGDTMALRPTPSSEIRVTALLSAMCAKLRPSLSGAHARLGVSAVILRCEGKLNVAQAREALMDLDLGWFAGDDRPEIRPAMERAARLLQPEICAVLMEYGARGDAAEAAKLLDLALAAQDVAATDKALMLLAERAEKGALYKDEPLAFVVGKLLLRKGDKAGATQWLKRAMAEFPDHWQSAASLAELAETPDQRRALLGAAYARGCRVAEFLRMLAKAEAEGGNAVAALAALDDLLESEEATASDARDAALLCMALEKPKWAQDRIAASRFKTEPALLRLDLICELAQNGLNDRARELSKAYGKRGQDDPYVESLLQRFGG